MEVSRSSRLICCRVFCALSSRLSASVVVVLPVLLWEIAESTGEGRSEGLRKGSRKAVCSGRSRRLVRVVGILSILRQRDLNASLSGCGTSSYSTPSFVRPTLRQQPPPQHLAASCAVDSPVMRWTSSAFWAISMVEARRRRSSEASVGRVSSVSSSS